MKAGKHRAKDWPSSSSSRKKVDHLYYALVEVCAKQQVGQTYPMEECLTTLPVQASIQRDLSTISHFLELSVATKSSEARIKVLPRSFPCPHHHFEDWKRILVEPRRGEQRIACFTRPVAVQLAVLAEDDSASIEAGQAAASIAKVKENRVLKIGTRPLFLFTTMAGPNLELFKVRRS